MHKIYTCVVLNLLVAILLVGCGGGGSNSAELDGKWIIKETNGVAATSDKNWMDFKAGGKIVQATAYSQSEGTWSLSGSKLTITIKADPNDPDDFDMTLDYNIDSLEGNRMVLALGEVKSVLEKQ